MSNKGLLIEIDPEKAKLVQELVELGNGRPSILYQTGLSEEDLKSYDDYLIEQSIENSRR